LGQTRRLLPDLPGPLRASSASNHRYHTHDYYKVDPLLGGYEVFDALLDWFTFHEHPANAHDRAVPWVPARCRTFVRGGGLGGPVM
jgi:hypothetical protein